MSQCSPPPTPHTHTPGKPRREQKTGKSPEKGKNRKKLRKAEERAQSKDQTEYSHIHLLWATMDLRKEVEEAAGMQKQVPAKSESRNFGCLSGAGPVMVSGRALNKYYLLAVTPFWAS